MNADRAAVAALLEALDAAASAKDIDRFLSYFVDGPDFALAFNGTVHTSLDEVRAFHVAAWADVVTLAFETSIERIAFPADDIAVLAGIGRSRRTLKGGEARSGVYALSLVVVRRPEGWRVLQAHESTPAPTRRRSEPACPPARVACGRSPMARHPRRENYRPGADLGDNAGLSPLSSRPAAFARRPGPPAAGPPPGDFS